MYASYRDNVSHVQVEIGDFYFTCCIESNDDNPPDERSSEPLINRSLGFLYFVAMCL